LFKLFTGIGFASSALLFRLRRLVRPETTITDTPASELSDLAPRRVLPLEDEPTTLIARYLFPTERYRGEWRRHWISPAKSAAVVLLYAVLGIWAAQLRVKPQYADDLTTWICVASPLLLLWQLPRWYFDRLTLTNKRLMLVRGVVNRRVEMMPLLRVTDIRYVQTPLGRVLGYGTFENESASWRRPVRRIRDMPHPGELYLRIVEEMYEPLAVEARLGRDGDDDLSDLGYATPDVDSTYDIDEDDLVLPSRQQKSHPNNHSADQIDALIANIQALVEILHDRASAPAAPPAPRSANRRQGRVDGNTADSGDAQTEDPPRTPRR
jgi:membrane protein YdbS with pleckstrin-like domain